MRRAEPPTDTVEKSPTATIVQWLQELGQEVASVEPLPGDVSTRRYFRIVLADRSQVIAVQYPASAGDACARYAQTTAWLEAIAVRVPRIHSAACRRGLMLLEDVGARTLFQCAPLQDEALGSYFRHALRLAERIATLSPGDVAGLNPPLDRRLLRAELERTWEAFAAPRTPPVLIPAVRALFDELAERMAAEPSVACHRDFMARNLVPNGPSPGLAVLDHQDLRLGPPYYDLASLLNDSLFPPPEVERRLLAAAIPDDETRQHYHRTAAQRTLKAAGTYTLAAAAGREHHLPLLRPTLERALSHLQLIPEGSSLAPRLRPAWLEAS